MVQLFLGMLLGMVSWLVRIEGGSEGITIWSGLSCGVHAAREEGSGGLMRLDTGTLGRYAR